MVQGCSLQSQGPDPLPLTILLVAQQHLYTVQGATSLAGVAAVGEAMEPSAFVF